jgi:predicted SpoU family rRNA methylase
VAALALFLDRLFEGTELIKEFSGKLKIAGSKKDKIVIESKEP